MIKKGFSYSVNGEIFDTLQEARVLLEQWGEVMPIEYIIYLAEIFIKIFNYRKIEIIHSLRGE